MSTWNETLKHIEGLRQKRREADDNLYAIQLQLIKAEDALKNKERRNRAPWRYRRHREVTKKIGPLKKGFAR